MNDKELCSDVSINLIPDISRNPEGESLFLNMIETRNKQVSFTTESFDKLGAGETSSNERKKHELKTQICRLINFN